MKKIFPSGQYKKDYKRYRNQPQKLKELSELIDILVSDNPIPAKYRAHELHGIYNGCMECHIQGDFLLIWVDENCGIIELVRLGSHAMLFGK